MPRAVADCLAFAKPRDAMATTLVYWPCCMAGMTFLPMLAVLRTPQRSLLDMSIDPPFASCKGFVIVSAFPWRGWPPPTLPGKKRLRRRTGERLAGDAER